MFQFADPRDNEARERSVATNPVEVFPSFPVRQQLRKLNFLLRFIYMAAINA